MSRGDPSEAGALEAARDAAWAELCGTDGEDEAPEEELASYGSLLGLGVRKSAKKPVIVLDPEIAEKAAQVMEINAGQLVVNPGQAMPGFAQLGLDPLGAEDDEDEPLDALEPEDEPVDEDEDAVLARWANRTTELSARDDEPLDAELPEYDAEPEPSPVELASSASEDDYELSAEPAEVWDEPAIEQAAGEELPIEEITEEVAAHEEDAGWAVTEEAALEQAWLDWVRARGEPVPSDGAEPLLDDLDDSPVPSETFEPEEELAPAVAETEPAEPELPRHELRVMVAQLSRPRRSDAQRLWIRLRRLWSLVKRIILA